jgi:glycosyltransferase involved in cell wall biosynthesis
MPYFSVVIATRNRPRLLRQALDSVLAQSLQDIEIIIVDDGSAVEHRPDYESIVGSADSGRVRFFSLIVRPQGHGASYVRNFGVEEAHAPYLCFLDDDDSWIDPNHLERARVVLADSGNPADLYMTNQVAFLHGEKQCGPIWIEDLPAILKELGNRPDRHGTHTVSSEELLLSFGFCHLNTLIVRRALFEETGGFDESTRWEEDRDLYLRLIDGARIMKYAPVTVARHNIPDPTKRSNLSTVHTELERRLSQLRVLDRAIIFSQHAAIREYGRRYKTYTLKRIAELLAADGRPTEAAFYAREALGARPTVKWAAYTAWRTLRGLASRSP